MNWKKDYVTYLKSKNFKLVNRNKCEIWTTENIQQSLALSFHERMPRGAALRELQNVHLHLSYLESRYYKQAIMKFIHELHNRENRIVIDIGCGDGRFTELLLHNGFTKIIATDIDIKPLLSLHNFALKNNYIDNLLIIRCCADQIPVPDGRIDLALAIGVFYYLNEKFENSIDEVYRILKTNGILINSEPDMEGAILKSIIFEEIEDVIENFTNRIFKEEQGTTDFKFRLFDKDEIKSILRKKGFKIKNHHGLSLLPSILRIKLVRNEFNKDIIKEKESKLRELFDYFDKYGSLSKHIIWKSQKEK